MKYKKSYLVFLFGAMLLLSGAEVDRGGGTLPLRGDGTLPLKLPAGGTLPLVMTGLGAATADAQNTEMAISLNIEIGAGLAGETRKCSEVLGPLWGSVSGSGIMIVGADEYQVTQSCRHKISENITLLAANPLDDRQFCLVDDLKTVADLSLISGVVSCSDAAGASEIRFRVEAIK